MNQGYGFDLTEFNALVNRIEMLGADMDAVAERVLDAGSEPARAAFAAVVPYDDKNVDSIHARDNITVSRTKTSKRGTKFRIIGVANKDYFGGKFAYLYYVEYGTSRMPAKPFRERGYRAAQAAALPLMEQTLVDEIETRLEG